MSGVMPETEKGAFEEFNSCVESKNRTGTMLSDVLTGAVRLSVGTFVLRASDADLKHPVVIRKTLEGLAPHATAPHGLYLRMGEMAGQAMAEGDMGFIGAMARLRGRMTNGEAHG